MSVQFTRPRTRARTHMTYVYALAMWCAKGFKLLIFVIATAIFDDRTNAETF